MHFTMYNLVSSEHERRTWFGLEANLNSKCDQSLLDRKFLFRRNVGKRLNRFHFECTEFIQLFRLIFERSKNFLGNT